MQNMDALMETRSGGPAEVIRELIALLANGESAADDIIIGVVTQVSPLLVQAPGNKIVIAADGSLSASAYSPISATKWTTMSISTGQKVLLLRLPNINAWACIGRYVP